MKEKDSHENLERPLLKGTLSVELFKQFYWLKKELLEFCVENQIATSGGKIELEERIEKFLRTGRKEKVSVERVLKGKKDSEQGPLTPLTLVVNYTSDPVTREFFKKEIGDHFRFRADVLNWIKEKKKNKETFTYEDIALYWQKLEDLKKDPSYQRDIPKQFEYNRFMKSWAQAKEKGDAKLAWNLVRSQAGEATYEHYLELKKKQDVSE